MSSPKFTSAGKESAGRVQVLALNGTILSTVQRKEPEAGDLLGVGLAVVPFRSPGCANPVIAAGTMSHVLLVGSVTNAYLYYNLQDPRCIP